MIAEYYKLLKEYVGFKSISNDINFNDQLKDCALWLKNLFVESGFDVKIINQDKKPIIVASYNVDDSLDTGLIYGYYDILNANQEDGRKENPFNLLLGKDKIVARGVENKGQILIHIVNIFSLIRENKLGYNVIFLLEGERETGSIGLNDFLKTKQLEADFVLFSVGNMFPNVPVVESGFRGNMNAQIEIANANNSLYTGLYGGIVFNPLNELIKLLSKLYDSSGQITIPYFYYEVENLDINQKTLNAKIPFDGKLIASNLNISDFSLKNTDFFSKIGWNPSVEIIQISSGKLESSKESIPNKAVVNLNFKLVNNQNYEGIQGLFTEWIKSNLSNGLKYNIKFNECYKAIKLNIKNYFMDKASNVLQNVFNNKVHLIQSGTSLPIVDSLQKYVSDKIVSVPLANYDNNRYGVNENLNIDSIEKGLKFSNDFFRKGF